jgi:hypothetical protein
MFRHLRGVAAGPSMLVWPDMLRVFGKRCGMWCVDGCSAGRVHVPVLRERILTSCF